jgi:thioredoxin reductase
MLLLEREAVGGQAGTTSLIRNYLGFPRGISGKELAARAAEQAQIFGTELVYAQPATGLRADGDDRVLTLADGSRAVSRTVVLATGPPGRWPPRRCSSSSAPSPTPAGWPAPSSATSGGSSSPVSIWAAGPARRRPGR